MEQFFSFESYSDLFIWAGVIIVYVLNLFFKNSSEKKGRSKEHNLPDNTEPLENPFEEIRREILRKKQEREGLKEVGAEIPMEKKMARENGVERDSREGDGPSQFQEHLEEQALQIQRKKEEAKRLKAQVEQIKNDHMSKKSHQPNSSSPHISIKVSEKVRSVLGNKSDIKAALIAGEILAQPLALRTGESARSTRN